MEVECLRPELEENLNVHDFRNFYWLKEELQTFCRENGMSASGSKIEITDRIATFLQTGEIQKPLNKRKFPSKETIPTDLNLDTVITENHRCSQTVRAFLKSEIPKFHFSTYIQNYFRENVGKTYRDVVNAWYEEEFIRDYFADPKNKDKNREDATKAWNIIKKLPGSNKYKG